MTQISETGSSVVTKSEDMERQALCHDRAIYEAARYVKEGGLAMRLVLYKPLNR